MTHWSKKNYNGNEEYLDKKKKKKVKMPIPNLWDCQNSTLLAQVLTTTKEVSKIMR